MGHEGHEADTKGTKAFACASLAAPFSALCLRAFVVKKSRLESGERRPYFSTFSSER
jgi:hypothetical protein